jgi:tetratricopeptide (TPR) repeat protein
MMSLAVAVVALALPQLASAKWHEAASDNFVVYADDSEDDIRAFSEQLERFHRAMEIVTGFDTPPPSPSNRVTVFVVKNVRQVQKLAGDGSADLAGFYMPRAGGSVAFVPQVEARTGTVELPMLVLLHEYAHHFLLSGSPFPTPRWLNEGAAEFFATAKFARDGSVTVGMPANHRAGELAFGRDVTARELLDTSREEGARRRDEAFYAKSWLLYHYLAFQSARQGQLRAYVGGMMAGQGSLDAGAAAFGNLDALERELKGYLKARVMKSLVLKAEHLGQPAVTLRQLSPGEAAMMPVKLRSRRGVTREQAIELLRDARAVAARHPGDAAVLTALAEAEYDAGNSAEAIAAADRALALDLAQTNAYVQKGYAMFRLAEDAPDRQAALQEAVRPFVALNRREVDHPLPLIYFFRWFSDRDAAPSELAVTGLERALQLAPFDLSLRFMVARQQAFDGRSDVARQNLMPLAYDPHGGPIADHARLIMARLEGSTLTGPEAAALFDLPDDQAEENAQLD